jgi:hypothetical protein
MIPTKNLQIRCASWAQVQAFYERKLRRGNLLSVKVAFAAQAGQVMTIGLEMPTGLVISIEGVVRRSAVMEGDQRTWIEIELVGFNAATQSRLEHLVEQGNAIEIDAELPMGEDSAYESGLLPETVIEIERNRFAELSVTLKRLRQCSVHDVLGVTEGASAEQVRRGWRALVKIHHPDAVARFHSIAISHLAEEILILVNQAYDRLRQTMVAQGRGAAFGSALFAPHGWLVGFEDLSTGERAAPRVSTSPGALSRDRPSDGTTIEALMAETVRHSSTQPAGADAFEPNARKLLASADVENAREMLAVALVTYPRSRPLRSLYYVASALAALETQHVVLARSQLETALAHDEDCLEAQMLLEAMRSKRDIDASVLAAIFGPQGVR